MKKRMFSIIGLLAFIAVVCGAISPAVAQEAKLSVGQKINLSIAGVPAEEITKVSKIYTVSDAGTLNLPYISDLTVRGLTRSDVEKKIEAAYRTAEIYTSPTVTVVVDGGDAMTGRFVTVTGEVQRPGTIPFRTGMRLLDAIGGAGSFSDFGDPRKVVLIRDEKKTTYNVKNVSENPKMNVTLQPNDTIIIPQRGLF